jgi:nicotinamidase-related amidase
MDGAFDLSRTALIAVDYQDECMRPQGAWPVCNADAVLQNAASVLTACRRHKLPVIYTKHSLKEDGSNAFRYEPLSPQGRPLHSVAGSNMSAICTEVTPEPTDIIVEKQRWTSFYCTQMDLVLNRLDVSHLIMMGVWTEACFETSVWDALWRDYRITIVKDACTSATKAMHMTSILDIANWLCGGSIMTTSNLIDAMDGKPFKAWSYRQPAEFPYELADVERMYDSI